MITELEKHQTEAIDSTRPVPAEFRGALLDFIHVESIAPDKVEEVLRYAYSLGESIANSTEPISFDLYRQYNDELQKISDGSLEKGNLISAEHSEANRIFALGVLAYTEVYVDRDVTKNPKPFQNIYEAFYSMSPSIMSYVGGIAGQIELLAYANRSAVNRLVAPNIKGELIYNGSFMGNPLVALNRGYQEQPTMVAKIGYLRTVENLSRMALGQGDYTLPFVKAGMGLCDSVAKDPGSHRLLRIMASQYKYFIDQEYHDEYVFFDDYEASQEQLGKLHEKMKLEFQRGQDVLRQQYPDVPEWLTLSRIAHDACIAHDAGVIDSIYLSNGKNFSLARPSENNDVTTEDAAILSVLYDPAVRVEVEDEIGVSMASLSFAEQKNLLTYMSQTNAGTYQRLCDAIKNSGNPELISNAFLATEFGDDFGESILNISEKTTPEQSKQIFETVNRFRERTQKFASWFRDYDPAFAAATERAMNERLTDALIALDQLTSDGELHVDVAPHRHTDNYVSDGKFMCDVNSIEDGIEIIKRLDKSMGLTHDIISAEDVIVSHVVQNTEQFIIYRFSSKDLGDVLLYVRPEGAKGYDRNHEYGNKKGVEASISFIVNPLNLHHLRSDKDPDAVSFRFDREGRMVDDSPFAEDRDPTRENGTVSVDISSGMGDPNRIPVKIGRFIAAGNILRAQRTGKHESLHHNTNYFDQKKYGSARGFAKLGIYTAHMAEAMIYLQDYGSHGSRYRGLPGILRRAGVKLAA